MRHILPESAEHHIANFWASWKQQHLLTQSANHQKRKDNVSTVPKTGQMSPSSQPSSSDSTPSGGEGKRKHTDTPASSKPAVKRTYAETAGAAGGGSAPKSKPQATSCGSTPIWRKNAKYQKGTLTL